MKFASLDLAAIAMGQRVAGVAEHFLAVGDETQPVGLHLALFHDSRHAQIAGGAVYFAALQRQIEAFFMY